MNSTQEQLEFEASAYRYLRDQGLTNHGRYGLPYVVYTAEIPVKAWLLDGQKLDRMMTALLPPRRDS